MSKNLWSKRKIPNLRFMGFPNHWIESEFGETYEFIRTNSFPRDRLNYEAGTVKNIHYWDIHTKYSSNFRVTNEDIPFLNVDIDHSNIKMQEYCKEGDLVIADASEDYADIWKTIEIMEVGNEKLVAGLHTHMVRPKDKKLALWFGVNLMKTKSIRRQMMEYATGISVLGISKTNLSKVKIHLPSVSEQKKITQFLLSVDWKIEKLIKIKELLEAYKKWVAQGIFSKKMRFKNDNWMTFPEWKKEKLGELMQYEQPTKYLVKSTDYNKTFSIPVLTAWKTFVLGYTNELNGIFDNLPVIIFDDFTTATKFVNFPFKVKSSAMKILLPKKWVDIRFVYESMQLLKYKIGGHERHWISKFSQLEIELPCLDEQRKVAEFLSSITKKIELIWLELEKANQFKKGLLQDMFI